jgi:hypothetical protein
LEVQLPDPEEDNEYKREEKGGELYFVRKDRERFEVQELLRAPAEVLGSGSFGSSYKAGLLSGSMVVKRFRDMNKVGKDDFYDHMTRLGRLSHPNLLPLVAFYYMKEEKLLVHDFVLNGSLASHLHGKYVRSHNNVQYNLHHINIFPIYFLYTRSKKVYIELVHHIP